MEIAICIVVMIGAVLGGLALTLLTGPGVWLMLLAAGGIQWYSSSVTGTGYFPLWLIVTVLVLALVGELLEFIASAVGAKTAGGSRASGVGAIAGAIIGAIAGTAFIPPVGTVIGSIIGAGAGALALEMGWAKNQSWRSASKVALGAAAGRAVATVIKVTIAIVVGVSLIVALVVRAIA